MNNTNYRFEVIGVNNHPIFNDLKVGNVIKLSKAIRRYKFDQTTSRYAPYKEIRHDMCLYAFDNKPRNNRTGADYEYYIGWIDGNAVIKNDNAVTLTKNLYEELPDDMDCVVIEKNPENVDPSQRTIIIELIPNNRKENI